MYSSTNWARMENKALCEDNLKFLLCISASILIVSFLCEWEAILPKVSMNKVKLRKVFLEENISLLDFRVYFNNWIFKTSQVCDSLFDDKLQLPALQDQWMSFKGWRSFKRKMVLIDSFSKDCILCDQQ